MDLAAEAGCRRLILFHHEPEHDDDALDRLLDDTRDLRAGRVAPGWRSTPRRRDWSFRCEAGLRSTAPSVGLVLVTRSLRRAALRAQGATSAIAVLPFENTGSYGQDKEVFEALELGLPAMLASALDRHPDAAACAGKRRVESDAPSSGARRRPQRVDAATAAAGGARRSGARYAVTGSFADFYGKFRINARVVDAETGEILKVVSNDDPKLQDRAQLAAIIQAVARAASSRPRASSPARRRPAAPSIPTEAITDFSRGLLYEGRGDRAKASEALPQRAHRRTPTIQEARGGPASRARGSASRAAERRRDAQVDGQRQGDDRPVHLIEPRQQPGARIPAATARPATSATARASRARADARSSRQGSARRAQQQRERVELEQVLVPVRHRRGR